MKRNLFYLTLISMIFLLSLYQVNGDYSANWTIKSPMPAELGTTQNAVVNEKIFVITGFYNFEYDPISNSWTSNAPMPSTRIDAPAVAAYDNKIYVIGGRDTSGTSNLNEAYDPATDTWSTRASMPTPRQGLSANVVGSKIYLVSGLVSTSSDVTKYSFDITTINEVYDPATDSWTVKSSIPNGVAYYASTVVDGKIYIIAGNLTQIYDPVTDKWVVGASSPYPVGLAAVATDMDQNGLQQIFVIGGKGNFKAWNNSFGTVDYTQIYNPLNDSWSLGPSLPTPRSWANGASVNGTIYVIGGVPNVLSPNNVALDIVEAYNINSDQIASPASSPTMSTLPTSTVPEIPPLFLLLIVTVLCSSLLLLRKIRGNWFR